MTSQIVLLFKIVLTAAFVTIGVFVAQYTRLAAWWRDQLGITIIAESVLLMAVLGISVASLFFQFNRQTSVVAAWCDIAIFALVSVVMIWRIVAFQKIRSHAGKGNRFSASSRNT